MTGETDLATMLRHLAPELGAETYEWVHLPEGEAVPPGLSPIMMFREAEGLTLVLDSRERAGTGLPGTFPSRLLTLNIRSSLAAVGLIAAVSKCLAEAGIAANPVSAFHHDHLFVPAAQAARALLLLRQLSAGIP
jgi:hypothetical protein